VELERDHDHDRRGAAHKERRAAGPGRHCRHHLQPLRQRRRLRRRHEDRHHQPVCDTTHYQRLLLLPRFSLRTGTVTIKVLSSGKTVQIDGLLSTRT